MIPMAFFVFGKSLQEAAVEANESLSVGPI